MKSQYTMVIQWSDEDQLYVVSLPEFGPFAKTHGATYAKAAASGVEAIESLIMAYEGSGEELPMPLKFGNQPKFFPQLEEQLRSGPIKTRKSNGIASQHKVVRR